jgi:hypothetical protein
MLPSRGEKPEADSMTPLHVQKRERKSNGEAGSVGLNKINIILGAMARVSAITTDRLESFRFCDTRLAKSCGDKTPKSARLTLFLPSFPRFHGV